MPRNVKGVKFHYTGGKVNPLVEFDHARCIDAVRAIQKHHMFGNGWITIGYSFVVCPHTVFEGRGLHHLPSANGAGLNGGHYAVLLLVGNSGFTLPNDEMLTLALDLVEYIRKEGPAGKELKGHRDGYSTDCPGTAVYRWIQLGCPRPRLSPTFTEEIVSQLPTLKEGDDSFHVKTLRAGLIARGTAPVSVRLGQEDCLNWINKTFFDKELGDLFQGFQRSKGLVDDRICGRMSWPYVILPNPQEL